MMTLFPGNQRTTNPEREDFYSATARVLSEGFALVVTDIAQIMSAYGYAKDSAPNYASALMDDITTLEALAVRGVELRLHRYRGRKLYLDGSLVTSETDYVATKLRIDRRDAKRIV